MLDVMEKERPNEVIHLGDHWRDAETVAFAYPDVPVIMVPGNCDDNWGLPDRLLVERGGRRILLAHGHQWRVKSGLVMALEAAWTAQADILLYGHTHMAECRQEGDLWVMNPGTVGGRYAPETYGVIEIINGKIALRIVPVE